MKKGDKYYYPILMLDGGGREKSELHIEEYVVTKITRLGVNLVWKIDGVTYGKLSSKHGDYGFLKNIPSYARKFISTEDLNNLDEHELFKTKKAAGKSCKKLLESKVKELNRIINKIAKL